MGFPWDNSPENYDSYEEPYRVVNNQIDAMAGRAHSALQTASTAIGKLGRIDFGNVNGVTPTFDYSPTDLQPGQHDAVTPTLELAQHTPFNKPPKPDDGSSLLGDLGNPVDNIPQFNPSFSGLNIPDAPAPIDTDEAPTRPNISNPALPSAPSLNTPTLGGLQKVQIPQFTFPDLPAFNGTTPTFDEVAPSAVVQWQEDDYSSPTLAQVQERVSTMLAGGTGIPKPIEDAIFARVGERADKTARATEQAAFKTWAARGFDMPPGMLVEQVNTAQQQSRLAKMEASRDVLVQAAQWEIDNMRFAVQQGIALESMLIDLFNQAANRALDLAKTRVDSEIALFNAKVGVFNARQAAFQVSADVYRTRLQGELSKLDVYRAQMEGQQAIAQTNEQQVRVYQARFEAVKNQVDVYQAQMRAVQIATDVEKQKIDAYEADIRAYSARIDADSKRFDAYETQVRGESSKADALRSEAQAFAATVDAHRAKNNMKVENIKARISAMNAATQRYLGEIEGERSRVDAESKAMSAKTGAYQADVQRYAAELDAETSTDNLKARISSDRLRNALAYYEVQTKEYDASMTRLMQKTKAQSDAIQSAGNMASQLAAGAMSAVSVGASISGSANQSISNSYSQTHYYNETPLA